jgi:hypothetical protein
MDDQMTKARLLEILRAKRAAWDALLARVPAARMTEPGVAGEWSVKDIIAHLTHYTRWLGDRMHEQLRGESYNPNAMDAMHWEERNPLVFAQNRDRPLAAILAEDKAAFQRLLAAVEAHSEAFLVEPQHFEGAPGPVRVWQMLRGDVYDHYGEHIPSIEHWLAAVTTDDGR